MSTALPLAIVGEARAVTTAAGIARAGGIACETLALESRYVFPKDSSLKILTSGLLGEQYLGLEAGADVKNLAAEDVIGNTQSAVVLESLISQFLYNKAADASTPDVTPKAKP